MPPQIAELFHDLATHDREIVHGLAPVEITAGDFTTSLRRLATNVRQRSGIPCHVRSGRRVAIFDSIIATHLYRIAQEAVQNAVKHSRATHVSIELRTSNSEAQDYPHDKRRRARFANIERKARGHGSS